MQQFLAIIEETFREARAKKTLIGFFIFSTIIIIITFFVFQNSSVQEAMQKLETATPGGAHQSLGAAIVQVTVLNIFYTFLSAILYFMTVCVGIFATTGFITSQLEKGTIDLLLSKPVSRSKYILGRYVACLLIILLEVSWFILGMWIVTSLGLGNWNPAFLLSIIFILLGFAGIYSVVVLISILSRSSALSIIVGIGLFFLSGLIALGHAIENFVSTSSSSTTLTKIANVLYYIFPQATDMSNNMKNVVFGQPVDWLPIGLIILLSGVYLGGAIAIFNKKEY